MKLSEMAERLGCTLEGDGDIEIDGVAGLEEAEAGRITFLSNPKYTTKISSTKASAIIVGADFKSDEATTIALLRHSNPYLTFARAIELFYAPPQPPEGIHPTAEVSQSAVLGRNVRIGAHSVVGDEAILGDDVVIHPNCTIYKGARIGSGSIIHSNCVVREYVELGARCILQNGVVIGADGFGYAKQEDGSWYKIVQSGTVVLEDDVE